MSHELHGKEIWALQREWRAVFARRLHRFTGRWVSGTDWTLFGQRGMLRYFTGAAAEAEYAKVESSSVYVVTGMGEHAELWGEKPALNELIERDGAIIFPPAFAWTAAVGPDCFDRVCFTYREWVDDDGENETPA